jgi:hypothetical protein
MTWKKAYHYFEGSIAGMFGVIVGMLFVPWVADLLPEPTPTSFRVLIYAFLATMGFRMLWGASRFFASRRRGDLAQGSRFSEKESAGMFFLATGFVLLFTSIARVVGVLLGVWW